VFVFARETNDALAGLVKKLDAEVTKAGKGKLCAAVVFLSDDDNMKDKIAKFKEDHQVKNVSLALDGSKGPEAYKLAKEADVTALLYNKRKVKSNLAFEKFAATDVEAILKDLKQLTTPESK
jgi:hypothetical protein